MSISEITTMELRVIKEALELTLDEFSAAEDDGYILNSGAKEAVDEAFIIINALVNKQDQEYLKKIEGMYKYD